MPASAINRICVLGQGHLGSPMAACFADRGFDTVGVDLNPDVVDAINSAKPPVYEPGLAEMLSRARGRLRATTSAADAVRDAQAIFIIVPTPSEPEGGFSLAHALPACETIGRAIADAQQPPLIVLTSTVMPGDTAGPIRHAIERASGLVSGDGFHLCYSPEFVALGNVIHNFLNPDFLLIGANDDTAADMLESIYRKLCRNTPKVSRLSLVNAELAKLSVNAYITSKITYANMLAEICSRIPGADVDAVADAVGLDSRIGRKYLTGAASYGGPCFPRDNIALATAAERAGARAELAQAVHATNIRVTERLADLVARHTRPQGVVGVLGLAYKPRTNVIEQSAGIRLARLLTSRGFDVIACDPVAASAARATLPARIRITADARLCAQQADTIVLITPWEEFHALDAAAFRTADGRQKVVIDCWRALDPASFDSQDSNVKLIRIGVGPAQDAARVTVKSAPLAAIA